MGSQQPQKRKYLIFLDIDGVFTSDRVHMAHDAEYKMWARLDPVAMDFMNLLHFRYPLEFVIMSTWKDGLDVDCSMTRHWVESAFRSAGFRGRFATPWKTTSLDEKAHPFGRRPQEVKSYLAEHGKDIEDFLLFDDTRYEFKGVLGKNRLVLTSEKDGRLSKHMRDALSMTGKWEKL